MKAPVHLGVVRLVALLDAALGAGCASPSCRQARSFAQEGLRRTAFGDPACSEPFEDAAQVDRVEHVARQVKARTT